MDRAAGKLETWCLRCGRVRCKTVTTFRGSDRFVFLGGLVVGVIVSGVADVFVPGLFVIGSVALPVFGIAAVWFFGGERKAVCPNCGAGCIHQSTAAVVHAALEGDVWVRDEAAKIHVKVVGGVVYLSGTVDAWVAKLSAKNVVENIDGVVDVVNDIVVESGARRRDERAGGE